MEGPHVHLPLEPTTIKLQGEEFWPLSGKPHFNLVLSKSHVKPAYVMALPAKMLPIIPSIRIPTVLTYLGKKWEMTYNGNHPKCKKFDANWRTFVDDNDLKAGDACVFELIECSSKNLNFRVQILRGDIPSELANKFSGESVDAPILIE